MRSPYASTTVAEFMELIGVTYWHEKMCIVDKPDGTVLVKFSSGREHVIPNFASRTAEQNKAYAVLFKMELLEC